MFSAIVTAFLVKALDELNPNYQRQSALLLHQLLNGRDPKLAEISDPTIRQRPANSAIMVNLFWFAALLASLLATLAEIICKGWLTKYTGGADPVVGPLRACRRHTRFMAFQQLEVQRIVVTLLLLLHYSVLLFFAGAVVYLFRMDNVVAFNFISTGVFSFLYYFHLITLPFITNPPFHGHSNSSINRLFVVINQLPFRLSAICMKVVMGSMRLFDSAILGLTNMMLPPSQRTILERDHRLDATLQRLNVSLEEPYAPTEEIDAPMEVIDMSQEVQEGALLWLSQVPLDPSESKALISSLVLIYSSHPYRFGRSAIVFLNSVLEVSLREGSVLPFTVLSHSGISNSNRW